MRITSNYLIDNYKDKYKLKTEHDLQTNQFPRGLKGELSDFDVYIECQNKIKIFSYGHGILQAYIPSLGRGRNILKAFAESVGINIETYIYQEKINGRDGELKEKTIYNYEYMNSEILSKNIITKIEETNSEILFKFHSKHFDTLKPFLKPKESSVNRSPFSTKYLPKIKYNIEDEDLIAYKNITSKIPQENILKVSKYTNDFIKTLITKKNTWDDIKLDMSKKCIKGKYYIHSLGQDTWNKYLDYLKKEIN